MVHRALAPQLAGVDSGRSPNLAAAEVSVPLLHQRREALVDSVLPRRHLEPSAAPSAPLGASYSIDKSNNKIQNRLCNQINDALLYMIQQKINHRLIHTGLTIDVEITRKSSLITPILYLDTK